VSKSLLKLLAQAAFLSLCIQTVCTASTNPQEIPLWGDETPPFSKAHDIEEYIAACWGADCAYQVVQPTITIYKAAEPQSDAFVVIVPGGGYDVVAIFHEGRDIAEALAERGISSAVLKYRLPNPETSGTPELVPLSDLHRAIEWLRKHQSSLGIEAERIGVMGFSAGGHLAAFASLHRAADPAKNPDFSMLIYGVSRLDEVNHRWLEEHLYYRKMTAEETRTQTLLHHVDENTPPAFLVHAMDDEVCHYSESTLYAEALSGHGVDAELHLYTTGGHGFGLGRENGGTRQWIELAVDWLKRL
jgi:acetyl esterase/lipase